MTVLAGILLVLAGMVIGAALVVLFAIWSFFSGLI